MKMRSKIRNSSYGGFNRVFKAAFPNQAEVAVKCVNHDSKQGLREFMAENESMGRLQHKNLLQMRETSGLETTTVGVGRHGGGFESYPQKWCVDDGPWRCRRKGMKSLDRRRHDRESCFILLNFIQSAVKKKMKGFDGS
ncbi:hypothetical protein F3Y22_tig00112738pilonHSYRG00416 [Hibiscus syriacus]|uniref:Serine-threonine/tyrosine-protein kinase catalytic domain-containing protein n=1 Tax=Hibiscus syriacus TaxID=106335 RepID=A0A6A2WTV6_HIBSY|nr:hypothetical protein F3Y22_tig00112738pilonHSYRG00416 [Hibiscus syriacus]